MKPISFLIVILLLAVGSSIAQFHEDELQVNHTDIHLNIYHVQGLGSSSFADQLSHDEQRARSLGCRLTHKDLGTTCGSSYKTGQLWLRSKSVEIPLNPGLSIGSGNYYIKVGLGTPAKYYAMLLDTGSSFSWLQCKPCTSYCHAQVDPLFNPSTSKSYKTLSCGALACSLLKDATLNDPYCLAASDKCVYTASYGDASYSIGFLSEDVLTLTQSQKLSRFVYGCGQDNEGLFGQAAGIVGLARDKLSMLTQLSTKYPYAFSYCLPTAASASGAEGFLSIGVAFASSSYKFTSMISDSENPSFYFLRLTAITVAGKPLSVGAAEYRVSTIIDSGTVITRLPMSVYAALRDAFVKIMSTKYVQTSTYSILDACFKGSVKSMSEVPQIRMIFQGGADLALDAPNILIEVDKGISCLAFAGSSQIAIIGNHQQQTFKVAYDISNSRIGFAAGGCH